MTFTRSDLERGAASAAAATDASPRLPVGVCGAAQLHDRRRLLAALEAAFPVRFEARAQGEPQGLGGLLDLEDGAAARAAAKAGLPALALLNREPRRDRAPVTQDLATDPSLDRRLRGTALPDSRLGEALEAGAGLQGQDGATVLASRRGRPTWIRAGALRTALLAPNELEPGEALRERLRDGRSAALLPLVHFLRELTLDLAWQPPPLRACFLFDDPNLHWHSYGFIELRALAAHAAEHGYHASLATIPRDAWYAHPAAVQTLAESGGAVSLAVHGNDHDGAELGRVGTEAEAVALAAQALRRLDRFSRRTGLGVDRVMVPPHERCSEATIEGLRRCRFEAITMTRPFPWEAEPNRPWLTAPAASGPLVGWRPADLAAGMPVLLRHPLAGRSRAELALRAFLGQPLILYGHQNDLRYGLGALGAAAAEVSRLGGARWGSLAAISRAGFETRREGARLALKLLTRAARVEVPADAEEISVEVPAELGQHGERLFVAGQRQALGEPVQVAPGTAVTVELRAADPIEPDAAPRPRRRPLALPRRALSESRDRVAPLLSRRR
jgi:hypothetical protein